jgi:hypothetical protein
MYLVNEQTLPHAKVCLELGKCRGVFAALDPYTLFASKRGPFGSGNIIMLTVVFLPIHSSSFGKVLEFCVYNRFLRFPCLQVADTRN